MNQHAAKYATDFILFPYVFIFDYFLDGINLQKEHANAGFTLIPLHATA